MRSQSTDTPLISKRAIAQRIAITAGALALWFWTQSLIGVRQLFGPGIIDALHQLTAPINVYLLHHPAATDTLLVVSSAFIDAFGLFLLLSWLFGRSVRPFLSLLLVMALRQLMQALCALPAPQGMIWHSPGIPSLLVTYKVANDFFFSGHTAIAVLGLYEVARFRRPWLTTLASLVLAFEIGTVLSLRVHYTMDVFTGIVTALLVCGISSRVAPQIDKLMRGRAESAKTMAADLP
ncbi:MAG TPA: phosphatase PAP2-related protein [Candidatus Angelobacter sp.]|nr:phosphatase PAP2-related protein [Candidatus Angelobacter sp.]